MNKRNLDFLDIITILSFVVGVYALEIALVNLKENEEQNSELKNILHYLDTHLQSQDELFDDLSKHLENQDRQLENLTK